MSETWRTGRKVGRTIYQQLGDEASDSDPLIGVMDTPELAARVVKAVNAPTAAPSAEAIDRAARALCAEWVYRQAWDRPPIRDFSAYDEINEDGRDMWRQLARAVIAALAEDGECQR